LPHVLDGNIFINELLKDIALKKKKIIDETNLSETLKIRW